MPDRIAPGAAAPAPEHGPALQTALLVGLVALLPFEPRQPTVPLLGVEMTLLEAGVGSIALALAWVVRRPLFALVRRPPLPLVLLSLYAVASLLSALQAPAHGGLAAKFALRMVVMAGCAWLVAAAPASHRAVLRTLAGVACVVALAALAEGAGVRALDPVLDLFREMPFNVAGSRRATGLTEYPNLAAAFLLYGFQAGVAPLSARPTFPWVVLPFAALLGAAMLFTYSRGALVATALGLVALAAVLARRPARRPAVPALAAVAVLGLCAVSFAAGGEIFRLRLGSEGTDRFYLARYEPKEASLRLAPGQVVTTPVRVTNAGRKTWAVDEKFHLSYHWWSREQQLVEDGDRTVLPRDLHPGESVLLQANVRAPRREGQFLLVWDMVHEHATWFSGQGVKPRVVPAVVSLTPGVATAPPPATLVAADVGWQPGRRELWRLALGMWKERPLLGFGADNFRWLYGPRAGHTVWDTRVFANNLFLEAAATTGVVGLLAICGTLLASGFVSARALWRAPAVPPVAAGAFALVVAIAAHGMVDYLLATTAHYLVLAIVVGLAATQGRSAQP